MHAVTPVVFLGSCDVHLYNKSAHMIRFKVFRGFGFGGVLTNWTLVASVGGQNDRVLFSNSQGFWVAGD